MAVLTSAIAAAAASASPRSTFTGETWRSAIAPKISGETNAATAEAANANGLMACSPCASSTVPSGTNQMPIAAAWMKNKTFNSAYSALRSVVNTGAKNSSIAGKIKVRNCRA